MVSVYISSLNQYDSKCFHYFHTFANKITLFRHTFFDMINHKDFFFSQMQTDKQISVRYASQNSSLDAFVNVTQDRHNQNQTILKIDVQLGLPKVLYLAAREFLIKQLDILSKSKFCICKLQKCKKNKKKTGFERRSQI